MYVFHTKYEVNLSGKFFIIHLYMLRKLTTLMTQPITLGKSDNVREVMEETKIKTGEITAIFAKGDPRGFAENYYSFVKLNQVV